MTIVAAHQVSSEFVNVPGSAVSETISSVQAATAQPELLPLA